MRNSKLAGALMIPLFAVAMALGGSTPAAAQGPTITELQPGSPTDPDTLLPTSFAGDTVIFKVVVRHSTGLVPTGVGQVTLTITGPLPSTALVVDPNNPQTLAWARPALSFFFTFTQGGTYRIQADYSGGTDSSGTYDPSTASALQAVVGTTTQTPVTLVLSPATGVPANTGSQHTVTAQVNDINAQPVAGITVRFSVTGANTAGGPSNNPTDQAGQATFTYTGSNAGTDAISAFADTNNNGVQDADEPFGAATMTWTTPAPPPPPPGCTTVGHAHGNQHFTSTSISGKKQDVHAVVDADCDVNEKTGQVYLHHAMLEIHIDGGPAINARTGNRRHDITSVTFPTSRDAVISGMANGKPFTVTLHDGSKGNQGDTVMVVYPGYPTISGSAQHNEVHIDNH